MRWVAVAILLLVAGCRAASEPAEELELGMSSITEFTDLTELFVEFPSLVKGQDSPFAVHLTRLEDFKPVTAGRVVLIFAGGGAPEERFEVPGPQVPGIFRPVAKPSQAGERQVVIVLDSEDLSDRHELGSVTVHPTVDAARAASALEEPGTTEAITFLKEQQWRTDFATAEVTERALRASVIANGVIRARPEGEVHISAPVAGRLVTAGEGFPRIGMEVRPDQELAVIAPRVGGDTDFASLEAAVTRAELNLTRTRRERQRLEELLEQEAVPERRVIDARHEEAATQAELAAANERLAQYRGTQRPTGGGAPGRISIRSPIAGTIVEVQATPGAFLEEGREMFDVIDLENLWLEVQIPEADIGRVRGATGAWFEVEGFDRRFEVGAEKGGRVVAFGGVVDSRSRTAPLVFEFPNPERDVRVGMFARVRVFTGGLEAGPAISASAVLEEEGQAIAYAQIGGETFERRVVKLGIQDGGFVRVAEGLGVGERVVTRGAYSLRLAAASTSIPAHGHAH